MISLFEMVGLPLVDLLWVELERLGESWAHLFLWLAGINERVLGSLRSPLHVWIGLITVLAVHRLFSVSNGQRAGRPLERAR